VRRKCWVDDCECGIFVGMMKTVGGEGLCFFLHVFITNTNPQLSDVARRSCVKSGYDSVEWH